MSFDYGKLKKKPVLVLTGPTAVGKTALSLKLAAAVNGAVVSADSMQVYRGMDIGSAKILPEERQGIPHYLIDVLEPEEDFNVALFKAMALRAMQEIWKNGKVPIITGGTGFYIQAVLRDIDFSESEGKSDIRSAYEKLAEERGPQALHAILAEKDPEAAREIIRTISNVSSGLSNFMTRPALRYPDIMRSSGRRIPHTATFILY